MENTIDIKDMDIKDLKILCYEEFKKLEIAKQQKVQSEQNISVIEQEISSKGKTKCEKPISKKSKTLQKKK